MTTCDTTFESFPILCQKADQRNQYSEVLKDFIERLQRWQSVKLVMKPAHPALKKMTSMDLECYDVVLGSSTLTGIDF